MANFYDQPPYMGRPTYQNGSSSIEERLARIEAHLFHQDQARAEAGRALQDDFDWIVQQLEQARQERRATDRELDEMRADRMAFIIRVGMWVIGGLAAALWAIVSGVLQSGIPTPG